MSQLELETNYVEPASIVMTGERTEVAIVKHPTGYLLDALLQAEKSGKDYQNDAAHWLLLEIKDEQTLIFPTNMTDAAAFITEVLAESTQPASVALATS